MTNKVDQASAEILRYKYDAGGRLTNRWSAAKGNTYYSYDAVGNLTNVDYPAGTTDLRYQYDARNRVTNMVDAVGTTKYTCTAHPFPSFGRLADGVLERRDHSTLVFYLLSAGDADSGSSMVSANSARRLNQHRTGPRWLKYAVRTWLNPAVRQNSAKSRTEKK